MSAAAKPESTAVATRPAKVLDLDSAKTEQRFVEAFSKGQLDKLSGSEQSMFLMALGAKIGLRAELGELMLYQGKPYICLTGRVRIAHQSGLLAGMMPRPATSVERQQFGAQPDEVLWVCDIWRHGATRPFRGWGCVNPKTDRNPVAKQYPREMAKKRAKYDALALAFPPDESLGPLHQKFIDAAEEQLRQHREALPVHGHALAQYDDTFGADTPDDDEIPAALDDASGDEPAPTGELPLDDPRPARTNALREG